MRRSLCFLFGLCVLLLTLTSCSTYPILTGSVKASDYHEKISTLSIVYVGSKLGMRMSSVAPAQFKRLAIAFREASIKTDLFFRSGLELKKVEDFVRRANKNRWVLVIDPVQIAQIAGEDITYNVSLYDTKWDHKVWASVLWVPAGWTQNIFQRFEEMGRLIVGQMQKDHLIKQTHSRQQSKKPLVS